MYVGQISYTTVFLYVSQEHLVMNTVSQYISIAVESNSVCQFLILLSGF